MAHKKYGVRHGPQPRKQRRKAAREEKRSHRPVTKVARSNHRQKSTFNGNDADSSSEEQEKAEQLLPKESEQRKSRMPKSDGRQSTTHQSESSDKSESMNRPKVSRGVKDRLAADDAEIEALERALGVKGKSKLPKAFEDEGLDGLLEGLDELSDDGSSRKRKRTDEGSKWLEAKRKKAQVTNRQNPVLSAEEGDDFTDKSDEDETISKNSLSEDERGEESFVGFDDKETPVETRIPKTRENPYIAPGAPSADQGVEKYIPPSLRKIGASNEEDLPQLRGQVQGLLNRLSDANLLTILADLERLYQNLPRQHVSTVLIELLCGLISDPSALQDTFIILHAGFASAVFKTIGVDFGAQMIQQCVSQFDKFYVSEEQGGVEKRLRNLAAFLAYLYSFQVVGSNLIYNFIRLFLERISENNTELLLKVVQSKWRQFSSSM